MNFESYHNFEPEDFSIDPNFIRWVSKEDQSQDFFWQAFLKKYPEKKNDIDLARSIVINTGLYFSKNISETPSPKMPVGLENKIEQAFQKNKQILPLFYSRHNRRRFAKYAVAASLVFLFSWLSLLVIENTNEINTDYYTGNAEWKRITLPDGSIVELNANSHLSVLKDWSKEGDRKVWLRGEAFFKVKKIPSTNAKFFVQTKDLEVEVLGTSFNVNTRTQKTNVFLEEGKVVLNLDKTNKKTMLPGDQISYSQKNNVFKKTVFKKEKKHSNWKNGVMTIQDKSLEYILTEIETIYGLDFILNSKSLKTMEGSLSIPVDNLPITLAIIERTLNVKVERYDKQIFISEL